MICCENFCGFGISLLYCSCFSFDKKSYFIYQLIFGLTITMKEITLLVKIWGHFSTQGVNNRLICLYYKVDPNLEPLLSLNQNLNMWKLKEILVGLGSLHHFGCHILDRDIKPMKLFVNACNQFIQQATKALAITLRAHLD